MERALPLTSAFAWTWDNIGKTRNKGIEVSIETMNMARQSKFQWNTMLTMAHNKEEIVELSEGMERDERNGWFVGQPIHVWYDYEKIGIWQLGEEEEALKNNQKPGQVKVKMADLEGDGRSDPETDRTFVGTIRPKFSFGLNNRFSYQGFELIVFMYGKFGSTIRTEALGNYKYTTIENHIKVDYWTPENPTNDYPRPDNSLGSAGSVRYHSTLSYAKGDFFKIRDITLGYNMPKRWLDSTPISTARVYATATNWITFCDSRIKPFDIERHMNGSQGVSFPMTKQLVFGVNLNF